MIIALKKKKVINKVKGKTDRNKKEKKQMEILLSETFYYSFSEKK